MKPSEYMKQTVRLNFDFPRKKYAYLKMLCAAKEKTFKEFATELFLKAIDEFEDQFLARQAKKRLAKVDKNDLISFEEACKLAGWDEKEIQDRFR